jgi:putative heme-binding domain-containing protein
VSGGWDASLIKVLLKHSDEYVRAWTLRLATDVPFTNPPQVFTGMGNDRSPAVLAQLACSARRMHYNDARIAVQELQRNQVAARDPAMPNLIWWAIESQLTRSGGREINWLTFTTGQTQALAHDITERYARRMMAGDFDNGPVVAAQIITFLQNPDKYVGLRGIVKALEGRALKEIPQELLKPLEEYWVANPDDSLILEIMARMNVPSARITLRQKAAAQTIPDADRIKAINLLRQLREPKAKDLFLAEMPKAKSDTLKIAFLGGLEAYDDPKIGEVVLAAYAGYPAAVKRRAVQLLLTRPVWAHGLFQQLDTGKFPKTDVAIEQARTAIALGDKELTAIVEKHYGKLAPATAGEKQARISWLNIAVSREKNADAARGKVLFIKHCGACHQLHGEGGKVGPDLTTADRKNRGYMLAQIVDPSGYIRPEYVVQNVLTVDERKLSGIASDMGESIALTNVVNDQPVTTLVAKKDLADIRPSGISLMPEKILDTLSDREVADLFAYLTSDPKRAPDAPAGQVKPETKPAPHKPGDKLKVCLVSGSFEYKSDASLAAFQKYLEANFPVECTRAFARAEKDKTFAGIENLATCDVAIFFTRRLQIDGEALEAVKSFVKSGKPIIGIRTASHGFQNWLEIDTEVLGGDYKGHFGSGIVCEVTHAAKAKDHPVLKGVSSFQSNGSLYKNPKIAADVTVLLTGSIPTQSEPVAWVREKAGRRVFYTSLGHPDDFQDENFIRLLVNGLSWVTKTELKPPK